MDIREILAGAVVIVLLSSSSAFATQGLPGDEVFEVGAAPLPLCRMDGGAEGGLPTDVADGREARLAPLSGRAPYAALIDQAAQANGLQSALLHAVVHVESSYNARAVSSQGALGLMQLMPGTARRYGVADAMDPVQNLHGGARYLRDLLATFDNDVRLALAAYNAGEYAVIRNGNRVPPLKQTVDFVTRVLERYRHNASADMTRR